MFVYSKELLDYYLKQIAYLRDQGSEFSAMFPKVAAQLDFSGNSSSDPQVERVLESFAFLAARLDKMLDDQSSVVPQFLLAHLNPYMLLPAPSCAIAGIELSPLDAQNGVVKFVKKGSTFAIEDKSAGRLKFSSVFDSFIYPFKVSSSIFPLAEVFPDRAAAHEGKVAICINVSAVSEDIMADIFFDSLRFYIHGDYAITSSAYDGIAMSLEDVLLLDVQNSASISLSSKAVTLSGFNVGESAVPLHSSNSDHFRLLQEYFSFPSKFMFFDVSGLSKRPKGASFTVVLVLGDKRIKPVKVKQDTFKINHVPVANLFYQQAQPINITSKQINYPVIPNHIQGQHSEFYAVDSVQFVNYRESRTEKILPYHTMSSVDDDNQIYWSVKPKSGLSRRKEQWFITLIDKVGRTQSIENSCLTVRLLCNSGEGVESLRSDVPLSGSGDLNNAQISFATKPTPNYQFASNDLMWSILCHYRLNFLTFDNNDLILSTVKTILMFMSPSKSKQDFFQINGIIDIKIEKSIRPQKRESWKGFDKHLEIHVYLDSRNYTGVSIFLFTRILFRVFESKRSVNHSLSLIVHYDNRVITHE